MRSNLSFLVIISFCLIFVFFIFPIFASEDEGIFRDKLTRQKRNQRGGLLDLNANANANVELGGLLNNFGGGAAPSSDILGGIFNPKLGGPRNAGGGVIINKGGGVAPILRGLSAPLIFVGITLGIVLVPLLIPIFLLLLLLSFILNRLLPPINLSVGGGGGRNPLGPLFDIFMGPALGGGWRG
jgi:hypothetical protein